MANYSCELALLRCSQISQEAGSCFRGSVRWVSAPKRLVRRLGNDQKSGEAQ
jgi:hypothetical protein